MPFGLPSPPSFHHAAETVSLRTRAATLSLAAFAAPSIPTFYANPLLFNGHLQTCYTAVKPSDPYHVYYDRKHLTNPNDGGHFAVDFVVDRFDEPHPADLPVRTRHMTDEQAGSLGSPDEKPMLVALHGLTGGSHEVYLRAVLAPLVADGVWAACVVNARGCAMSSITTAQLFNARFTEDIRETAKYLKRIYPNRPLFVVGFSLGANILINYLAEEGENCVFRAAVVCSNPWNLELCCKSLHRTFMGGIYSKAMGGNLKALFEQHIAQLSLDPRISVEGVRAGVYMDDFDRELTAKVFSYPTVGAYYRAASSIDNLLRVRIPTFIVHARDDPIACDEAAPYEEVRANPYTFMAATGMGGHLSWFEAGGGRWFAGTIVGFLKRFAAEVVEVVAAAAAAVPVASEGGGGDVGSCFRVDE